MIKSKRMSSSFNTLQIDIELCDTLEKADLKNATSLIFKHTKISSIVLEENISEKPFQLKKSRVSHICIEELVTK